MFKEPRYEIGVDYEGVDKRHLQVDEVRRFSNELPDRIFYPECGVFYTESLEVFELASNKPLVRGIDYILHVLDSKATNASGKEVCGLIEIISNSVAGVRLNYQYVGGLHMSGMYILEQLLKMYSDGITSSIHYDDVMDIPDEFDPAYHTAHVHNFYGTKGLLIVIERIRTALISKYNQKLEVLYNDAADKINVIWQTLHDYKNQTNELLAEVIEKIKIQTDEYIFTSTNRNPREHRGYGEWRLVEDVVLNGVAGTLVVGSGSLISISPKGDTGVTVYTDCYIWKNIENSTLTDPNIVLTLDKDHIAEGEKLTATLKADPNKDYSFKILSSIIDPTRPNVSDISTSTNVFRTDSSGSASVVITAIKDKLDEGTKTYMLVLTSHPDVRANFSIEDTSKNDLLDVAEFTLMGKPIEYIGEGVPFQLRVTSTSMNASFTAKVLWTISDSSVKFTKPLPDTVNIINGYGYVDIEIVADGLSQAATRYIDAGVYVNDSDANFWPSASPLKPRINILDTSKLPKASLTFLDPTTKQPLEFLSEGKEFIVNVASTAIDGRNISLQYEYDNLTSDRFTGLLNNVVINNGYSEFKAKALADHKSNELTQYLTVKAVIGTTVLTSEKIVVLDTTKDLRITTKYVKDLDTLIPVSSVDEGEKFYFIINGAGFDGSVKYRLDVIASKGAGVGELNERVIIPNLDKPIYLDRSNGDGFILVNTETLAIEMTAIADYALNGAYELIMAAGSFGGTLNYRSLVINDTSVPIVTAAWSSSKTTFTPVSQVGELSTVVGSLDKMVYLWIEANGKFNTFLNPKIVLGDNSVATFEDVILATRDINLVNNKQIIDAVIKADFASEGNELFVIKGIADNYADGFFETSLIIIDDSILYNINLETITPPVDGTNYSDVNPFEVKANFPPLPINTKLSFELTIDGVVSVQDFNIPANTPSKNAVFTLNPDRVVKSKNPYDVSIRCKLFNVDGTPGIYSVWSNKIGVKVLNKNLPVEVEMDLLDGSTIVNTVKEGKTYTLRYRMKNPPHQNTVMVCGFTSAGDNNTIMGSGDDQVDLTNAQINKAVPNPTDAWITETLTIANNRKTDVARTLELFACSDWDIPRTIGGVYYKSGDNRKYITKKFNVEDTSKTPTYALAFNGNAGGGNVIDEGKVAKFILTVTNGTVGDSVALNLTKGSLADYESNSVNGFGKVFQLTGEPVQVIEWWASVIADNTTNGDRENKVTLSNNYAGVIQDLTYTIKDTSKTPILSVNLYKEDKTTITNSIDDDGSVYFIGVDTGLAKGGDTVKLIKLASTRADSDFVNLEIGINKTTDVSGKAFFKLSLRPEYKTHGSGSINFTAEIVNISSANRAPEKSYPINDVLTNKGIVTRWLNASNAVISSVNEGDKAFLEVISGGGTNPLSILVENNGGRPATGFDTHGFGAFVRDSDTQAKKLEFVPKRDGSTNTPATSNINVKLSYADNPSLNGATASLKINDTSTATTGYVKAVLKGTSTNASSFEEDKEYTITVGLKDPAVNDSRYKLLVNTGHGITPSKNLDNNLVRTTGTGVDDFVSVGSGNYELVFDIKIAKDGIINPTNGLSISFDILDIKDSNRNLVSTTYTIIDYDSLLPEFSIEVIDSNGVKLSTITEGQTGVSVKYSTLRYTGKVTVEFTGDVTDRLNFTPSKVYPYNQTVLNGSLNANLITLNTYADLTTNANPNGNIVLKNASGVVVASHALNITDTSKTPEVTDVYYSKDQAGLTALRFSINQADLIDNTFYLQVITKNITKDMGVLEVVHPLLSSYNTVGLLNEEDLVEGTVNRDLQAMDNLTVDPATGIGRAWKKFKLLPHGDPNAPALIPTPNGTYTYYNPADFELVLEPGAVKKLVIKQALSGGSSVDYDAGSGGLTGFYILDSNTQFRLRNDRTGAVSYGDMELSNNNSLREYHTDIPIEWLLKNAKAFFIERGGPGYPRDSGGYYDLGGPTFVWGDGVNFGVGGTSGGTSVEDYNANAPSIINKLYTADGIDLAITEAKFDQNGTQTVTVFLRNNNTSNRRLFTTYGRSASYPSDGHGLFGAGLGSYNAIQDAKVVISGDVWPSTITQPVTKGHVTISDLSSVINYMPVAYQGKAMYQPFTPMLFGLNYYGVLTKCEIMVNGDHTARGLYISRGRIEGWKKVQGVFDGTYTIINVPVNVKFRVVALGIDIPSINNGFNATGKVKLTFSDGTTFISKPSTNYMYKPGVITGDYAPVYPFYE